MENDANGVAVTGANPAYAMSKIHAVRTTGSFDRTMMHSKRDGITLM
jgi:hypothetical protein